MTHPPAPGPGYDGPATVAAMIELATALAGAKALPAELHNSPADILLAMLAAQGLRIPVFAALQNLYPGKNPETGAPDGLAANALLHRALARRAGYTIHPLAADARQCTLELYAPGELPGLGEPLAVEHYTLADAETAGLTERDPYWWEHHPGDKLYARCSTRLVARHLSEVSLGLAHNDAAPAPRTPAPAPAAPAPAPDAASPLAHHLDAATRYYDPATDPDGQPDPIDEMRPDRAALAARAMRDAAAPAAAAAAAAADDDPTSVAAGQQAALASHRLRWAAERLHHAEARAEAYYRAHPEPAPAPAPAPAPRAARRDGEPLPRRPRSPAPAPAPAADPQPAPAPAPAARKTAKKAPAAAAPPASGPAPAAPAAPGDPQALAAAILDQAAAATTIAAIGKLYATANGQDLLNVPLRGTTLRNRLMALSRALQAAAPQPPPAAQTPAPRVQIPVECTCDGKGLTERHGAHAAPCPLAPPAADAS